MRSLSLIGLTLALGGVLIVGGARTWETRVAHDKQDVVRMAERMQTVCVGRFLIDMPADAQIELAKLNIDGFEMAVFSETTEEFQRRLADREMQVRRIPDHAGGNKNLEVVKDVKTESGLVGKIFAHSRKVTEGTRAKGLELEAYRNEGIAIEALVHADGISFDLASEYYDPDQIEKLPKLVSKLSPNPDGRIPVEPGFCIDRGYFRDPLSAAQGEQIMMFARLPKHPDVEIMLILAAGLKPDEQELLERSLAAENRLSPAGRMRVTRLRGAPREISGLTGAELVRRGIEGNDAQVYSFWWEVNSTEDDVFIPHIVFKMTTGTSENGPVPTSMSEDAALHLWDKISSSIRLRSAEPIASRQFEAATIPLRTYASAGEYCPESGWWLCGDGGNGVGVLGGQRQYIKKGELVLQALLLPRLTLWDKVRGLQPSFESKNLSTWNKNNGKDIAIGSFSSTGAPCPASGRWGCDELHALDGTRWFARGSLLPPATFTVAPGIFGHSSTAPQAIQRRRKAPHLPCGTEYCPAFACARQSSLPLSG